MQTKLKKKLPINWGTDKCSIKTIYIRDYFKVEGASYTDDLRLRHDPNRASLQAEWSIPKLPADKRSKTKRESTGTNDVMLAVQNAIEKQNHYLINGDLRKRVEQINKKYTLERYWNLWFDRFCKDNELKRNGKNNIRNQKLYWQGEGYGIKHQPFASKNVDDIDYNDLDDYWRVLDVRGANLTVPCDMAGQKKQIKTLLNKLIKTARLNDKDRYGKLPDLVYPEIRKSLGVHEAEVFTRQEWDLLLKTVCELSGGKCQAYLTNEEYMSLPFDKGDSKKGQRNWVDLYDAMQLLFFFHLRSEDMPRLERDWIYKDEHEYYLYLEVVKGDRVDRHKSISFRDNGDNVLTRIKRRKKGFLLFSENYLTGRETKNYADSQVIEKLNSLLQYAVAKCGIKKRGNMTLTNIRHTAFYLLIKEYPDSFRTPSDLTTLGYYGFSSEKMLRERYVNKIQRESLARSVRKLGGKSSIYDLKQIVKAS
tara:strand:- start:673 stop:2106 length:1434 start_codon:yes stop_codon:yes gene_type:complete